MSNQSVLPEYVGPNLSAGPDCAEISGSASAADVLFTVDMLNYQSATVSVVTPGTGCTITYEQSSDGLTNWVPVSGLAVNISSSPWAPASSTALASTISIPKRLRWLRARVPVYGGGTVSVVGDLLNTPVQPGMGASCFGAANEGTPVSGSPLMMGAECRTANKTLVSSGQVVRPIATVDGRLIMRPHSIPENEWATAAATGGLLNATTPVVFKAAAGGTLKNYLTSAQVYSEALTTATELTIENGDGTVLWRSKIPTGGLPLTPIRFEDPLKSTANASLQIRTNPASGTGAVYFNAQGYVAP